MANVEASHHLHTCADVKASSNGWWQQGILAIAACALLIFPAGAAHADWTKYSNPAPVIGADGHQHAATCSAFPGTDPTFSFWAKQGTAKSLVVFFEGG